MKLVERSEIIDFATYEDTRDGFRKHVMEAKALRRVHLGEHLTFLFENPLTVRYQVQEMVRIERIVREKDIQHELDTYNELLGGPGGLGATLLVEIDDEARRAVLLREWMGLPAHLYVVLADGRRVSATYDARQVGEDRLSAVQYLRFPTEGQVPVSMGSDLPALKVEGVLSPATQAALKADLSGGLA